MCWQIISSTTNKHIKLSIHIKPFITKLYYTHITHLTLHSWSFFKELSIGYLELLTWISYPITLLSFLIIKHLYKNSHRCSALCFGGLNSPLLLVLVFVFLEPVFQFLQLLTRSDLDSYKWILKYGCYGLKRRSYLETLLLCK